MFKYFIGIDNGCSGSIGVVAADGSFVNFIQTPVFEDKDYTKARKNIHRVDVVALRAFFTSLAVTLGTDTMIAFLERPLVNPGRFNATLSGVRALEATLIVLAEFKVPVFYEDSRAWQRAMLPEKTWVKTEVTKKDKKGKEVTKIVIKADPKELKKASKDIAARMFPAATIKNDGDGLLIAEYCRRRQLGQV